MLDSLFDMQLPLPVKLLVAFGIVLVLLAAVMWIFRRFSGNRLGALPARGRQPRLAVIDAAAVDARRRLVLIRRDNVEHLVMIGGPSDVLIEQNIVRAVPVAPTREPPMQRAPAESMPREPMRQTMEPAPRPPRQELPPRQPRPEPVARRPVADRPERPRSDQPAYAPRSAPEPMRAPRMPPPPGRVEPELPPEVHAAPPTADTNLADMAHKLEAALRRPSAARRPDPAAASASPVVPPPALTEPTPPTAPEANSNGGPAATTEAPAQSKATDEPAKKPDPSAPGSKSLFDSLEEEMASLLNRPPDSDPPEKK